jgi:flagellar hook-associated protein 1 FlgK
MDLLALLSQSSMSLSAHSGDAATASHNLQNAGTPGYARQRAELAATLPAERVGGMFIGRGVQLQTVSQARDRFIEAQMPRSLAAAGYSSSEAEALQALSALNPDQAGGLSASIAGFYAGLRALSQNPGDPTLRQSAIAATRQMAQAFNSAGSSIDAARRGVDEKLAASLAEVNTLATSISRLNVQISTARASGGEPNDLLDARQKAQDRLAALTGATPVANARGDVNMLFPSGQGLVSDTKAGSLSVMADPSNGGHLAIRLTAPDGSTVTTLSSMGGELGGYLSARDGALRQAEQQLDTLAWDMTGAINTVHQAGYGLDGVNGRSLLDAGASATGAARALQVHSAVLGNPSAFAAASSATTVPGDASNVFNLINTENTALSSGTSAVSTIANIIGQYGSSTERAKATAEHENALLGNLNTLRQSASGVSIDEEMISLTKAQRAYQAVAKVITTTDSMLDTLMSLR